VDAREVLVELLVVREMANGGVIRGVIGKVAWLNPG
jgi:hypothetical protein